MRDSLKLYVWPEALSGIRSDGIMFALAKNPEEAREIIVRDHCQDEGIEEYTNKRGCFTDLAGPEQEPEEQDDKCSYVVWGEE